MLKLLNYKDRIEEIEVGQTLRINHDDCNAGADTRRRLYITRPEASPHAVIAYCHNCQEGGGLKTEEYQEYRDHRHGPAKQQTVLDVVVRPTTLVEDINDWPSEAQAWAIKNRLSQDNIDQYRIGFDTSTHRVYLPRYSRIGIKPDERDLMGYQLRKVREDNSPKYLTVSASEDKGFTIIEGLIGGDDRGAVLVEDLVSGIKVDAACGKDVLPMDVIVNYGTKVNLEALYACKNYQKFIVWLDNDSTHVIEQAKTMARTWSLLSGFTARHYVMNPSHSDPKHYNSGVIGRALKGITTWTA